MMKNIKPLLLVFTLGFCQIKAQLYTMPVNVNEFAVYIKSGNSLGSGFILQDTLNCYLITAKHVLYVGDKLMSEKAVIEFYAKNSDQLTPDSMEFNLKSLQANKKIKVSEKDDIVIIEIGEQVKQNDASYIKFTHEINLRSHSNESVLNQFMISQICLQKDTQIGNDVYVVGYPASLGFNKPLLRKGVLAGRDNANKKLILDCFVYPGNSGGPAIIIQNNELLVIGVVVQTINYVDEWQSIRGTSYGVQAFNSGYSSVEPIDKIMDLIRSR